MIDIIRRLSGIEHAAQDLYGDAARYFRETHPPLSRFLDEQSCDEAGHDRVMGLAERLVQGDPAHFTTPLGLDEHTEARILAPFDSIRADLSAGTLTAGPMFAGLGTTT